MATVIFIIISYYIVNKYKLVQNMFTTFRQVLEATEPSVGSGGAFSGGKWPGCEVNYTTLSSVEANSKWMYGSSTHMSSWHDA
jgi:hypothetical protein